MAGATYVGTYATLRGAIAAFADLRGEKCHVDRTRREPLEVYCRKADVYLDWVARSCYMPANYVAAVEFRMSRGELPRAAPGIYWLHLEGKEKPFSQRLAAAYDSLHAYQKTELLLLTSDLKEEYMRGARVFHIVYSRALEASATAAARRERSWWATEVLFNVARTDGWIANALARGLLQLIATRGGGVNLSGLDFGQKAPKRYRITPFSEDLARKYKELSVVGAVMASVPTPKSFGEYAATKLERVTKICLCFVFISRWNSGWSMVRWTCMSEGR